MFTDGKYLNNIWRPSTTNAERKPDNDVVHHVKSQTDFNLEGTDYSPNRKMSYLL